MNNVSPHRLIDNSIFASSTFVSINIGYKRQKSTAYLQQLYRVNDEETHEQYTLTQCITLF
jgi:hypothetical protein